MPKMYGIENIRIKSIELTNFRNIENGFIELENSKITDYWNGLPSILGLYGQNGSGKSSVIMALSILRNILLGNPISKNYSSCIRFGCDSCTLKFTFTF